MRTLANLATIAVAGLALAACTYSRERLLREVGRVAQPGMTVEATTRALNRRGFQCSPSYVAGFDGIMCSRNRATSPVSGCIHRANLSLDAARRTVTRIEVPPPACASL